MKNHLIFMLLLGLYGYSQDIIYFDSNWKKANNTNSEIA